MPDVFVSYARSTEAAARRIGEALAALGYDVWRDDRIPAHRPYADVIRERLAAARAVVVVWSADAARSEWVRSEAERARAERKLVQLSLDGSELPMPFDQIQCANLSDWAGETDSPEWRAVLAGVAALVAAAAPGGSAGEVAPSPRAAPRPGPGLSICVLPFVNMSGDAEQEYFSDGISVDIITDLSKVPSLRVLARDTAFTFKDQAVDIRKLARRLNVSHVLEGSVRKAGGRVRINAQLINGDTGAHVWAERYDRELTDIFALQDEVNQAIVAALKLKLLPEERQATQRRGTESAEAYDLFLMARQHRWSGNSDDPRMLEAVARLCGKAVEIDPAFAPAWALIGAAEVRLRFVHGRDIDSTVAVERALALDPDLAEAHAARASNLRREGRLGEAWDEAWTALRLDPDSFEANGTVAAMCFGERRWAEAAIYYERAAVLEEAASGAPFMLITCYTALGDAEAARRAARMTLTRVEATLEQDRSNGAAMGQGVAALAVLGEAERTRDWIGRALLLDPDNLNMRYNFACALCAHLADLDGALDLLKPYIARVTRTELDWAKADPDIDALRPNSRFQAMVTDAEARLAAEAARVPSIASRSPSP